MENTYAVPMYEKSNIDKILARYEKKANKYGKKLEYKSGEPYLKTRMIYEPMSDHTLKKVGEEKVEVYDLTIDSEIIVKDGYSVIARIEHLEGGNFVTAFGDEQKEEWFSAKPICEHCMTKHYRRITYIVKKDGEYEKQVGSTCLKDYCGIDPQNAGMFNELQDIILKYDFGSYDWDVIPKAERVFDIVDAVAAAVNVKRHQGFVKSSEMNSNKEAIKNLLKSTETFDESDYDEAKKIVDSIKCMKTAYEIFEEVDKECYEDDDERIDAFYEFKKKLMNRKSYLKSVFMVENGRTLARTGYCKDTHLGIVAYLPVAYENYLEAVQIDEKNDNERKALAETSNYVGEIGSKIEVVATEMTLVTKFETRFGYTYLYKMKDANGNVYVWFSSKFVRDTFGKFVCIVKDHSERDGIKQTVVTRCKAIA